MSCESFSVIPGSGNREWKPDRPGRNCPGVEGQDLGESCPGCCKEESLNSRIRHRGLHSFHDFCLGFFHERSECTQEKRRCHSQNPTFRRCLWKLQCVLALASYIQSSWDLLMRMAMWCWSDMSLTRFSDINFIVLASSLVKHTRFNDTCVWSGCSVFADELSLQLHLSLNLHLQRIAHSSAFSSPSGWQLVFKVSLVGEVWGYMTLLDLICNPLWGCCLKAMKPHGGTLNERLSSQLWPIDRVQELNFNKRHPFLLPLTTNHRGPEQNYFRMSFNCRYLTPVLFELSLVLITRLLLFWYCLHRISFSLSLSFSDLHWVSFTRLKHFLKWVNSWQW